MPVITESPANESHQTVEATRQARSRSPRSSSPLKIGTKAAPSAASATSERIRLGIWYATVKALIASPCTVKIHAAAASRNMPDEPACAGRDGEQRGRDRHAAPLGCLGGGGGGTPARRATHDVPG